MAELGLISLVCPQSRLASGARVTSRQRQPRCAHAMLASSRARAAALLAAAAACGATAVVCYVRAQRRSARVAARTSLAAICGAALEASRTDGGAGAASPPPEDELAAAFEDAARWVAQRGAALADAQRLRLYALFKQATAGACRAPAPSRLDFVAHAKWQHWQQLGALPRRGAMVAYLLAASQLASDQPQPDELNGAQHGAAAGGSTGRSAAGFGPVQSTLASCADGLPLSDDGVDFLEAAACAAPASLLSRVKAGDAAAVAALLTAGAPPDAPRDAAARTPLLWAADAGEAGIVAALLAAGADANAADAEGATPLLHAALCGHEAAARALLAAGADAHAVDQDGCCAAAVRPVEWSAWWPAA